MKVEQTLHETKDYGMFKYIPQNRKTVAGHVANLANSMSKKNLTKDFPIIVNHKMEILDGQNRLQALQQLGYPVWYRVASEMDVSDISLVNTVSKKWAYEDFLHQYTSQGYLDYLKIKDFMDWAGIKSVGSTLKILKNKKYDINKTGKEQGHMLNGGDSMKFKQGTYSYPNDDSDAKKTVINLKRLSSFTVKKDPYEKTLVVVYDTITKDSAFDIDRLFNKLEAFPVGVYNNANTLIDQLEKAYNYNVPHEKRSMLRRY